MGRPDDDKAKVISVPHDDECGLTNHRLVISYYRRASVSHVREVRMETARNPPGMLCLNKAGNQGPRVTLQFAAAIKKGS